MDINRKTAFFVLRDVDEKKAYSHIAVNNQISRLKPSSPPFVRELSYGVIRRKLYLDFVVANFVKTPIEKLHVVDRSLLRMGLYQLLFMDSVPDYAAVNETIDLAKRYARGREGFINGVLRQFLRDKDYVTLPERADDELNYLCIKYSYARWIVEMLTKQYGPEEAEKILDAGNRVPPLTLRVNPLLTSRDELLRRLLRDDYRVKMHGEHADMLIAEGVDIIGGKFYEDGLYSVQDEAAFETIRMLDPRPGQTVVDVCAAPGGKTMAIAELMRNNGKIYALDIYKRKLSQIEEQAKRLGVNIVQCYTWDATRADSELSGKADRVLVDAPCSGLGTVRKKPEIKYKEWDRDMEELPILQRDILTASASYVKSGGILVYSTCTILRRENEEVTSGFLRRNSAFEKVEEKLLLPHKDDTDGFYICKMRKKDLQEIPLS